MEDFNIEDFVEEKLSFIEDFEDYEIVDYSTIQD